MSLMAMIGALALAGAPAETCERELVVLGAGQDAGAPQIGQSLNATPPLLASSIAVIDRANGQRFLFDATPNITAQLGELDAIEPPARGSKPRLGLDGVFLTHAHIGHYLGLAWFGREAAGAKGVPVFAMPRMAAFLRENGPWSQLVELGNIDLGEMSSENFNVINDEFGVLPILVPHRDEYSETVGFLIMTPGKRALYIPDLDSWDEFQEASGQSLEELVMGVDYALIDATFWDDNELLDESGVGRDMSEIPHPRVSGTMERLSGLDAQERAKVHFIHMNHTNPVANPQSDEARKVREAGFNVARRGLRLCLSNDGE